MIGGITHLHPTFPFLSGKVLVRDQIKVKCCLAPIKSGNIV
ncbi:MAG: hypothetical protein JWQ95_2314 [Sphaerisporangium sp.]|jgi:hypothetical protein|nr:hypothetical protein [Sphaerisporangium sp.]